VLLILDCSRTAEDRLARALGLSLYEARQRIRRGGYQLERILPAAAAAREEARLSEAGLAVRTLPEAELRLAPQKVRGGGIEPDTLRLTLAAGERRVAAGDLLLIVRGPILREHQASAARQRFRTASPEPGFRIHLHLLAVEPALELDPADFHFRGGPRASGSSHAEIEGWLKAWAPSGPVDDGFRRLPPALAPAAKTDPSELALAATREPRRSPGPLLLDNLAQFHFYSAWRGELARRLRADAG